jgi:ankyrin repeat protein
MSDGCMQWDGRTAIMHAAMCGHGAIVQMLLAKGAALDQEDKVSEILAYILLLRALHFIAATVHHVHKYLF